MTLTQRFLLFLTPVVILVGTWNGIASWLNYKNEVQFIATKAMHTNIQELQVLSKDPLFHHYIQHIDKGYLKYAQEDLHEIRYVFRGIMEEAKKYGRMPDHLILFSPTWEILALESDERHLNKKTNLLHSDIHSEPFFTQYQDFSTPYSQMALDRHKTVLAIGTDKNQDGIITKSEVQLFLHSEFLLPIADFRNEAFRRMINNLWMGLGQIFLLILTLVLAGRFITKPFQNFTNHIATIALGNFNQPLPDSWKVQELNLLSQALNNMAKELKNREARLIQANMQTEESRIMLRQVLNAIPVHVFWKDGDCRYMGCNERFAKMAGFDDPVKIVNQCDLNLIWSSHAETFQKEDRKIMSTGQSHLNYLECITMPDQREHWLEINKVPLRDPDGNIIGVLGTSHDVTERIRMEEKLKFNQFSVMNAKDAIFWIDANARFIDVNQEACNSLGYTRDELLTLSLHDIAPELHATQWSKFWNEITTRNTMVLITNHQCKDQSSFPVEFSVNILDYQGTPFAIASVRNITERKLAEQALQDYADKLEEMVQSRTKQLIHAERLATLGTFSAGMAHEINNPNAFIAGNVQFLQQFWQLAHPILKNNANQDASGRIERFLGEIDKTLDGMLDGSMRISKIVDSLKTYSKGGMESDRVECRLEEPLRDAENLLQHRFKNETAKLIFNSSRNITIYCDRQQMAQVFVNLFNNALDALNEMGEIPEKRITVESKLIEEHIWIWVKDNGPGIPDSAIGRIFDPFYTSKGKTKGTGLGLSIVEGIIKDHRGQITIFSPPEPDRETEVVIILPSIELYKKQQAQKRKA